jgi:hypothetical protein
MQEHDGVSCISGSLEARHRTRSLRRYCGGSCRIGAIFVRSAFFRPALAVCMIRLATS